MANIIIYGMGVTGQALYSRLHSDNNVWWYDDRPQLCSLSIVDIPYDCIDMCIVSPGISSSAPLLTELLAREIPIVGEWQYCYPLCSDKIVSVTGTNGKTTICQMIHHILTNNNVNNALLGNGGIPWSSDIGIGDRVTVLESSSFQLDNCDSFAPYISVLSNLSCDHISYHGSMDNYIQAKCNNFVHQQDGQWAIFNGDDGMCMQLASQITAKPLYYSISNSNAHCYIDNNSVVVNIDRIVRCDMGVLLQYCSHNVSNALCAILVAFLLGVDIDCAIDSLSSYRIDSHKMQTIATIGNITYIDDSKATNISATLSAVDSITGDIALMLGGSDKGYCFDSLIASLASNVVAVIAMGDTADSIASSCSKYNRQCIICSDMDNAIMCATRLINNGGTVLLSPACASFDNYTSYVERGQHFTAVVGKLLC